jgi:hypothetical protein
LALHKVQSNIFQLRRKKEFPIKFDLKTDVPSQLPKDVQVSFNVSKIKAKTPVTGKVLIRGYLTDPLTLVATWGDKDNPYFCPNVAKAHVHWQCVFYVKSSATATRDSHYSTCLGHLGR